MKEAKEGFYWARKHSGEFESRMGPLCIVFVYGDAPFLSMYLLIRDAENTFQEIYEGCTRLPTMLDATEWELIERIEYPKAEE